MQIIKVLTRVYLSPIDLDEAIAFYENLFTEKGVGSILLIAGSAEALSSFKSTHATFLVDSLNDFREALIQEGAVILAEPNKVPTGVNMRAMHPDGTIIEYVEFA
jgi:predicted enzyme related to lactoylglutathione lyase